MKITRVVANADYLLTVTFDNEHTVTLDMKRKLQTVRFSELSDWDLFNSATTDGRAVMWPNGTSISTTEIVEILGK